MTIKNKFNIDQIVYLITDPDQFDRIVTGIQIRPTGLQYGISIGMNESWHYDIEINCKKNLMKSLS